MSDFQPPSDPDPWSVPGNPSPASPAEPASAPTTPPATGGTPPADYSSSGEPLPPPAAAAPGAKGWKAWVGAGAAAAVIAVGAGFVIGRSSDDSPSNVAAAGPNGQASQLPGGYNQGQFQMGFPGGGGTAGTITEIDGSTITVKATDGTTTTVKATDDTKVTESGTGSVDDIEVGDNVMVIGATADSEVTATRIVDNGDLVMVGPGTRVGGPDGQAPDGNAPTPPDGQTGQPPTGGEVQNGTGPAGGMPTAGEVTKVDGDTITVKTSAGDTVTVTTTSETVVTVTEELSIDDLQVGDTIRVMGTLADKTVTATSIRKGDLDAGPGFGPGGPGQTPPAGAPPAGSDGGFTTQTTI